MAQRGSLIQKLDEFIRAYYLNQLVNGALRSLAVLVCAGIGFALVESVGRFGIAGRTVLFWTLLGGSAVLLSVWLVAPLLKWARIDWAAFPGNQRPLVERSSAPAAVRSRVAHHRHFVAGSVH